MVTLLIIGGGIYLQKTHEFLSKSLKIEPKSFYLIMVMLCIIIALCNYIAVVVFGSWETLILIGIIAVIAVYAVILYLRKRK